MKPLNDLSSAELADQLAELDQAIETDQGVLVSAQRRIRKNYRLRDQILSQLSVKPVRKGWV
jgi:hypothetical protein